LSPGPHTPSASRFFAWTASRKLVPEAGHAKECNNCLLAKIRSADALAISDYGFGIASPQLGQFRSEEAETRNGHYAGCRAIQLGAYTKRGNHFGDTE